MFYKREVNTVLTMPFGETKTWPVSANLKGHLSKHVIDIPLAKHPCEEPRLTGAMSQCSTRNAGTMDTEANMLGSMRFTVALGYILP
eukprot:1159357-Pelagomonas_calceolata.AAC.14